MIYQKYFHEIYYPTNTFEKIEKEQHAKSISLVP